MFAGQKNDNTNTTALGREFQVCITVNKLSGYVVKHSEEYLFFADNLGTPTDDFEKAAIYGSRLAAHQQCAEFFKRAEADNDDTWQIVRRKDVVVRAAKFEAPFQLVIADPIEAIHKIYELHNEYSKRLTYWLRNACTTLKIPQPARPVVTLTAPKWCGMYLPREHECHYPIVFAMMDTELAQTVAHEVVHSFQRVFNGNYRGDAHGGDFYALMLNAAREPVTSVLHSLDNAEAKRLSEHLLPYWREQGAKGVLSSLPLQVVTQPMKRKGVF